MMRWKRLIGVGLFALCFGWAIYRSVQLGFVSPVHWPLILPNLSLEAVPVFTAAILAAALFFERRCGWLAVLVVITSIQALLVSVAEPGIRHRYDRAVRDSQATWQTD